LTTEVVLRKASAFTLVEDLETERLTFNQHHSV
jgi:hypothetical protein